LASLTRVETQVAGNNQQLTQARQTALMALNLALGELQRAVGPDQRATAPASVGDTNVTTDSIEGVPSARWTGVWGRTAADSTEFSDMAKPIQPRFLQWLVSGNEQSAFTASTAAADFGRITAPAIDAVPTFRPTTALPAITTTTTALDPLVSGTQRYALLVGKNSADFTTTATAQANAVLAPMMEIKSKNVPGLDPATEVPVGRYAWWVGDEGVKARVDLVDPYETPTAAMTASAVVADNTSKARVRLPQRTGVERITGLASFPINSETARKLASVEQLGFADPVVTTDVRRARFHDITTATRSVLSDQLKGGLKRDLTFSFAKSANDYRRAVGFSGAGPTPLIPTSIMPSAVPGPTWEQLHSLANVVPTGTAVTPRAQTATQHGVYPVLVQARIFFTGSTLAGQFQLSYYPVFIIANPYTVPLAARDYQIRLDIPSSTRLVAIIEGQASPFWNMSVREVFEGQMFRLQGGVIPPGESRIFTLASSPAPEAWAPVKTYNLENDYDVGAALINLPFTTLTPALTAAQVNSTTAIRFGIAPNNPTFTWSGT
ncbi:MAG: hypothetical protein H7Y06_00425, partial [Opitutaceae bacterium]|nr:hypothetical protein [Opitutaceae bacterium]